MIPAALPSGAYRISRDPVLEAEYATAKAARAIGSLTDLSMWPDGLAERFTQRLEIVKKSVSSMFGDAFVFALTSSWVQGSGIDEYTHTEEPEFFELKKRRRTWDGRFINKNRTKNSDYDVNIFYRFGYPDHLESLKVQALWDIMHKKFCVRIDVYPYKNEGLIWISDMDIVLPDIIKKEDHEG